MVNQSIGILEVVGFVTATACIDAMVKSAYIEVFNVERVGSGLVTIMIQGDLASIKEALEVGAEVAGRFGELIAVRAIARPYEGLEKLIAPKEVGGKE
ncbi:BMC domain-containing protein [Bacillus sp. CGMCC 1.16607]|uniref:BMC domain-containing protein n=1 Tax=Bacillus sp. CGMCC 1.16607 TaxID=3351842 RepID=UPI00363A9D22